MNVSVAMVVVFDFLPSLFCQYVWLSILIVCTLYLYRGCLGISYYNIDSQSIALKVSDSLPQRKSIAEISIGNDEEVLSIGLSYSGADTHDILGAIFVQSMLFYTLVVTSIFVLLERKPEIVSTITFAFDLNTFVQIVGILVFLFAGQSQSWYFFPVLSTSALSFIFVDSYGSIKVFRIPSSSAILQSYDFFSCTSLKTDQLLLHLHPKSENNFLSLFQASLPSGFGGYLWTLQFENAEGSEDVLKQWGWQFLEYNPSSYEESVSVKQIKWTAYYPSKLFIIIDLVVYSLLYAPFTSLSLWALPSFPLIYDIGIFILFFNLVAYTSCTSFDLWAQLSAPYIEDDCTISQIKTKRIPKEVMENE